MPRSKKPAPQAKPASKTPMTKVEFILTLPADMPAKEAVAKAAAAGYTLTEQRVHAIRWAAKHKGKKGKALAKAAPAVKAERVTAKPVHVAPSKAKLAPTVAPKPTRPITKTAYILGFPPGTPAADVVAKAGAEGIKLTIGHVYSTRTAAKAKAAKKSKGSVAKLPVVVRQAAKPAPNSVPGTSSLEQQFVDLVLNMGSSKARELLVALRARVQQLKIG